jgi:8-oxo-dGTP pyrophosphatase MutT (NUDIX family)|tara:strand:+ start:263 stop:841 length:579 start_codon:yes stop_codon:yes gene_type:complete
MIQALTNRLLDFTPKNPDESLPQAAVLILCYEKDNDLYFVMTERSNSLPSHPGEVAFPGGKREKKDKNLKQTALREATEEISLDPAKVEILGQLDPLESRFGLSVTPFIGILKEKFELEPNPDEVADIFHLPLSFFKNNPLIKRGVTNFKGETFDTPVIIYDNHEIWGLTLAFTLDFLKLFNIKFKDDLQIR